MGLAVPGGPALENVKPNAYKMASKGMSFEAANDPRSQAIRKAREDDPEGARLMEEYSGAKTPDAARAAASEEDSGRQSVNLPKVVRTGGGPYAGGVILNELGNLAGKAGPMATKAGQKMGAAVETAKAAANKPAAKPPVNNNISKVQKPVGLIKASTPAKPTRAEVSRTIRAAEPTPSPRPKAPAKSATKAATSASEYLEKRDTSAASKAKAKSNIKQKKNQGKGQNL